MLDLPMLSYDVTRRLFPAYKAGDKVMLLRKDTSQTEPCTAVILSRFSDGRFYIQGDSFGTECHEEDLTPVDDEVDMTTRTGIYRHSSGKLYLVVGGIQNVTTKKAEIMYRPLYRCDKGIFSRTPENFDDVEENGEKKFVKIANR